MSENNDFFNFAKAENITIHDLPTVTEEVTVEEPVVEVPVVETPKVDIKSSTKSVVLYALKDITIPGVGSLVKGYNSVPANKVEKYLAKASVRIATEEEIKTYHTK
jgi:hypothetical protein